MIAEDCEDPGWKLGTLCSSASRLACYLLVSSSGFRSLPNRRVRVRRHVFSPLLVDLYPLPMRPVRTLYARKRGQEWKLSTHTHTAR
jgi:hypothetical protein